MRSLCVDVSRDLKEEEGRWGEGDKKASTPIIPSLSLLQESGQALGLIQILPQRPLKSTLRWQPALPLPGFSLAWAAPHLFLVFDLCISPFQATSLICVIISLNGELSSVAEESTGGVSVPAFPEATLPLLLLKVQSSSGVTQIVSRRVNPLLLGTLPSHRRTVPAAAEIAPTTLNGLRLCKEARRTEWPGSKGRGHLNRKSAGTTVQSSRARWLGTGWGAACKCDGTRSHLKFYFTKQNKLKMH